jgi:hypothetical protein
MLANKSLHLLFVVVGIVVVTTFGIFSSAADQCSYHANAYQGLQLPQLTRELETTGLIGRIHGAVSPAQLFVMSVREPDNFFNHREFSLLATDNATLNSLSQVDRHDRVCVQGRFIANPSPQKHIAVKSIKTLESSTGRKGFPDYARATLLPAALKQQTDFVGKVHAIDAGGQILVVEYQDQVFPIFVNSTEYTKGLYRGDIIRLAYQIQERPQQPTHLQLNLEAKPPIAVIDAIASWHQQQKTLAGALVKFPKSPQLNFDVYAIEVETQGVKRDFTLVNFENMQEFQKIRDKLAKIWDGHTQTIKLGRNMLINPQVVIEAKGRVNIVSPEQANPQILLNTAADIQLKPL